jgi:1-phosphofructokinase/tagatose 6-phosphate kinase
MIKELRKLGVMTVVDTDGEPLRHAVRAEPDVVSPNVGEAEELVGHEFNDDDERALGITEVVELGAREAIMTVPDGCYAHVAGETGPQLFRVRVAEQEARAAVGSGDAFLAGYVAALYDGATPEQCLRFGVACGAESTQHFGAGVIDPQAVERLLPTVEAVPLALPAEVP